MLDDFARAGIDVTSLRTGRAASLLAGGPSLRKRIAEIGPDVVHTNGLRADVLVGSTPARHARVSTLRGILRDHYPERYGRIAGGAMARTQMRALTRMDAVAACSEAVAVDARRVYGLGSTVIPNAVDTERFRPIDPAEKRRLRDRLGLPPDARIAVVVGGLIARKAPDVALDAFSASRWRRDGGLLVFVGDGPLAPSLAQRARGSPVRFAGRVDDVAPFLQAADALVSASRSEGLPNAILEAMACGIPVALSDIEPHCEIMAQAPGGGSLGRVNDATSIAGALDGLVPSMGMTARARAEARFASHVMVQAYEAFYASAAGDLGAQAADRFAATAEGTP